MASELDDLARTIRTIDGPAAVWHRTDFAAHRRRYEHDLARVRRLYRDGDVLEVGSLPCHLTVALKLAGFHVIGIDVAPARAQTLIDRYELRVERCDIEREPLPFDDGQFDCVVFAEVFEHLRVDPLFVLSELNRVMRPGGRLLLTTPNLYSVQNIARFVLGYGTNDPVAAFSQLRHLGHMGHVREYSPAEIRRFLALGNFTVTETGFHHYHYPRGKKGALARVLFAVLPRRLRTFQVLTAEKAGPPPGLSPLP